jgi:hypothetical protein
MAGFEAGPGDERLTTAMLSDALDECGLRSQVLAGRLPPVVAGSRAFGRAATARFAPSDEDEPEDPYRAAIDFIGGLERGELVGAEAPVALHTAGGGQPGNLRPWRSDRANETTCGFFRNILRTLERAWVRPRVLGWPDLQVALSHLVRDAIMARRFDETTLDRIERLPAVHLTGEGE